MLKIAVSAERVLNDIAVALKWIQTLNIETNSKAAPFTFSL